MCQWVIRGRYEVCTVCKDTNPCQRSCDHWACQEHRIEHGFPAKDDRAKYHWRRVKWPLKGLPVPEVPKDFADEQPPVHTGDAGQSDGASEEPDQATGQG